jgi:hypothetical protein
MRLLGIGKGLSCELHHRVPSGREGVSIFGAVRLAFRHTPMTEAGRRLEAVRALSPLRRLLRGSKRRSRQVFGAKFEEAAGQGVRGGPKKDSKAKFDQKKQEGRKQERLNYERKLQESGTIPHLKGFEVGEPSCASV